MQKENFVLKLCIYILYKVHVCPSQYRLYRLMDRGHVGFHSTYVNSIYNFFYVKSRLLGTEKNKIYGSNKFLVS